MNETTNSIIDDGIVPDKALSTELNAVVTLNNAVSPWLRIIQVAPRGWEFPDFEPGQYTTLGLYGSTPCYELAEPEVDPPAPAKLLRRPYSIVSSPRNKDFVEFYINLVPTGHFTPRLFTMKIGDPIWLSDRVVGNFTFESVPDDANVILIANGTGLAPFVSMLTTHLRLATSRRVVLVHGVRHSWDLGYRSVFMAMQHLRLNFTYVPVVSRPHLEPVPWRGATGRIQDLWGSGFLERVCGFKATPANTHLFLCGSPQMIDAVIDMTAPEGFKEQAGHESGQIHVESYWHRSRTIEND